MHLIEVQPRMCVNLALLAIGSYQLCTLALKNPYQNFVKSLYMIKVWAVKNFET